MSGAHRSLRALIAGTTLSLVAGACSSSGASRSAKPTTTSRLADGAIQAFPSPGTPSASAKTGITFRGTDVTRLGSIAVSGSQSGAHTGRVRAEVDGHGVTFVPDAPFTEGEKVTVHTTADVTGAVHGTFQFTVARQFVLAAAAPTTTAPAATATTASSAASSGALHFKSTDLAPPAIHMTGDRGSSDDVFLSVNAAFQNGPEIVDGDGQPVWFHPLGGTTNHAVDFALQRYEGKPVLTWFQGRVFLGYGAGEYIIDDQHYHEIARVKAGNGYAGDVHEFQITPQGTALFIIYNLVLADLSSVGGGTADPVVDGVVQEVDIKTGDVLFEWHSLAAIPLQESDQPVPDPPIQPFDYVHLNAVALDGDDGLLVSARHTSAIYRLDRTSGAVEWELGGKSTNFTVPGEASFAYQHDVRRRADGTISLFDNGATTGETKHRSRGMILKINERAKTVSLVEEFPSPTDDVSSTQGSVRELSNGDFLVGWGNIGGYTEFAADGRVVRDARMSSPSSSYRALPARWVGLPTDTPVVDVEHGTGTTLDVSVSWNGATEVTTWQVLAGADADHLEKIASQARKGFETTIAVTTDAPVIVVRALDASGTTLATSKTS